MRAPAHERHLAASRNTRHGQRGQAAVGDLGDRAPARQECNPQLQLDGALDAV
jgi:hypothetical protein